MVDLPRDTTEAVVGLQLGLERGASPGNFRRLVALLVLLDEERLAAVAHAALSALRRVDQAEVNNSEGPEHARLHNLYVQRWERSP